MASQMSQSNQKSSTSSGANTVGRVRARGLPKFCRCGQASTIRTSKTSQNPGRLFHCCPYGSERDNYHLFKWTDESMVEEIEDSELIISELKEEIENLQFEVRASEAVVNCFEKEMKDAKASITESVKEIEEMKKVVDC